jgi:hypothetical protein
MAADGARIVAVIVAPVSNGKLRAVPLATMGSSPAGPGTAANAYALVPINAAAPTSKITSVLMTDLAHID